MIVTMKIAKVPFERIKAGTKTIEMRLFDEKRKHISAGDTIEFKLIDDPTQIVTCKVLAVHIYATFADIYRDYNKIELGYSENEVADPRDMERYYSKEEQAKNCVVGIEIALKQ